MAQVTGLTAERMLEIEGASIVGGTVDSSGHLILTKHDGTSVDAGRVEGEAATALLTILDTGSINLTLSGAGTPEDPWVLSGEIGEISAAKITSGRLPSARKSVQESLGTVNLDTLHTPGEYYQNTASTATVGRNYPLEGVPMMITVLSTVEDDSQTDVGVKTQIAYPWFGSNRSIWIRTKRTNVAWTPWVEHRNSSDPREAYAMAQGMVSIAHSNAALASIAVTLPAGRFPIPPFVQVTQRDLPGGSAAMIGKTGSKSATGFTLYSYNATGLERTVTVNYEWQATIMTATTADG